MTTNEHQPPPIAKNHKSDPLLPPPPRKSSSLHETLNDWITECAWPGMGLFGESYLLFSVGTLRPVWEMLYPDCLVKVGSCSSELVRSLAYSVVVGVILGMVVLGIMGDNLGRRRGSITTASLMAASSAGMTVATLFLKEDGHALFLSMVILLFFFGVGVGGEYPMSAASASEKAIEAMNLRMEQENLISQNVTVQGGKGTAPSPPAEQLTKGKRVILVFSMQGMGIMLNSLTLTALLYLTNQRGSYYGEDAVKDITNTVVGTYDPLILLNIWRFVYGVGAVILLYVLISRIIHLKESQVWKEDTEHKAQMEERRKMSEQRANSPQKTTSKEAHMDTEDEMQAASSLEDSEDLTGMKIYEGQRLPLELDMSPTLSTISDVSKVGSKRSHRSYPEDFLSVVSSFGGEGVVPSSPKRLLMKNFGFRLFGTSATWMLWDVAFYGNKLFQSSFLLALAGDDTSLLDIAVAITLNAFVALLGYFAAASIIDSPLVGRLRLQQLGFAITGTLFLICGFFHDHLGPGISVLLYFGSSFFGQCGPNATTFLIPAEIFPTEMRTMCHGISAASGKCGALLAAVLFNYLDNVHLFLISGYCCFISCFVTFFCIPETNGLDLLELDKKWRLIVDGRKAEYFGMANAPEFLSYYERRRRGLMY